MSASVQSILKTQRAFFVFSLDLILILTQTWYSWDQIKTRSHSSQFRKNRGDGTPLYGIQYLKILRRLKYQISVKEVKIRTAFDDCPCKLCKEYLIILTLMKQNACPISHDLFIASLVTTNFHKMGMTNCTNFDFFPLYVF